MKIAHGLRAVEGIGCAITEMEIEIEDESVFDLFVTDELFNGNGNIIKVTESPTGMGTGMMPRRPDQTKSRLAFKGHFRCQNSPSSGQDPEVINLRLSFDELDMILSMN